jgi:hypothetical protein
MKTSRIYDQIQQAADRYANAAAELAVAKDRDQARSALRLCRHARRARCRKARGERRAAGWFSRALAEERATR